MQATSQVREQFLSAASKWKTVQVEYFGPKGVSSREIIPVDIIDKSGKTCLVAFDRGSSTKKNFLVSRIWSYAVLK